MKIYFLLITIIQNIIAYEQSVRVTGRLMCHGHPAQYAELQLVSKKIIGGDAFARDVFTDPDGYFDIAGYIDPSTWSKIDARLYIWHKCYEKPYEHSDPCSQWFEIGIPPINVNGGPLAQKEWNIGEIELKDRRSGQELTSCS
uniref:Transthyretin-like family protein n=1 Tax=Caenorhabditis tropicalis TaxID=1561998 RepID=A0A1I7TCB4_9PELO